MKKNGIDLGLREAFDDLFSTQEDRDNAKRTFLRDIPVAEMIVASAPLSSVCSICTG